VNDDPSIYINASTPGFVRVRVSESGSEFDAIFDESAEDDTFRPSIVCAPADATGLRSRDTTLIIRDRAFEVVSSHDDGMGLTTVFLREQKR